MVRLTADLIWKSPHFFNAIRERELDLRGFFFNPNLNFFQLQYMVLYITLERRSLMFHFTLLLCTGNKIPVIENLGATEVSFLLF